MVDKRGLKAVNRNEVILVLLVLGIVGFVLATTTMNSTSVSPVRGGNYSGTMLLNCSTNMNTNISYNVTFFYNVSGGEAYLNSTKNNLTGTLWNETATDNAFNITIDTTTLLGGLADGTTYNISCFSNNGTDTETASVVNVTIDNTAPNVSAFYTTVNNGNYSGTITLNVSVSDTTIGLESVYFNITNSSGDQHNFTKASNPIGAYYNISIDTTGFTDGKYNITVWANDTELNNLNNSERIQITIDDTAPSSVTLTTGTGTTTTQNVITITAVDATSGINTCSVGGSGVTITGAGTGTQTLTHTGLNCGTSYSYIVTCFDQAGNSKASASTSFSTSSCSSGGSGGGSGSGSGTTSAIEKVNVFSLIVPGTPVTISGFEETVGVEEILLSVTEEANNVKVTVKKFDTQPAEITVSKTGNVHKYLQIETENLVDKLEKAVITIKVQKNWLLDSGIDKANMALYKFDDSVSEWKELLTVYKSEDDNYYYYDTELTSFSYFAISEKVIEEPEVTEPEPEPEKSLLWLWIVIGIVLVAVIVGGGFAVKKRS